jgi:hypothetical protein
MTSSDPVDIKLKAADLIVGVKINITHKTPHILGVMSQA